MNVAAKLVMFRFDASMWIEPAASLAAIGALVYGFRTVLPKWGAGLLLVGCVLALVDQGVNVYIFALSTDLTDAESTLIMAFQIVAGWSGLLARICGWLLLAHGAYKRAIGRSGCEDTTVNCPNELKKGTDGCGGACEERMRR